MNYKLSIAQKVIAKLLQEFFRVDCCKVIAPVKHGYTHFYTLSALCSKIVQKKERRLDALPALIQWRRDPDSNRG